MTQFSTFKMVDQGRGLGAPQALARYEDVVANPQLFMTTLEKLHATMSTKFMIPIIGGRDLDLHKLFVEVTSRGGIEKILREKRWKDVTATFNFPTTATNASFVLRKYYFSLLQHYERIYYFNSPPQFQPQPQPQPHPQPQPPPPPPKNIQQPSRNTLHFVSGVATAPSVGCPVTGIIDGKFESGYLVTVTLGNEKMKGVLYQTPPAKMNQVPQASSVPAPHRRRRRRRRKSELRKRDPTHPKPNRSGYNFFFSEQHAMLKPLHPGKDREISRMIGELWNNLKDNEKAVYQEKAVKDKERYMTEMEDYKERQRENQVISDAVPIQQRFPGLDVEMVQMNPENDSYSSKSETDDDDDDSSSSDDDDDEMMDKDEEIFFSNAQTPPVVESSAAATAIETTAGDFQVAVEDGEEGSPANVEHENSIPFTVE